MFPWSPSLGQRLPRLAHFICGECRQFISRHIYIVDMAAFFSQVRRDYPSYRKYAPGYRKAIGF
jgi:hypothetical protein